MSKKEIDSGNSIEAPAKTEVDGYDSDSNESIVVHDRAGRRQFIRRGAAFVAMGGAVGGLAMNSKAVYADDCDRNAGSEKNAQAPGSDSDTGEGSDPTGCGRAPKAKITHNGSDIHTDHRSAVKKVKV